MVGTREQGTTRHHVTKWVVSTKFKRYAAHEGWWWWNVISVPVAPDNTDPWLTSPHNSSNTIPYNYSCSFIKTIYRHPPFLTSYSKCRSDTPFLGSTRVRSWRAVLRLEAAMLVSPHTMWSKRASWMNTYWSWQRWGGEWGRTRRPVQRGGAKSQWWSNPPPPQGDWLQCREQDAGPERGHCLWPHSDAHREPSPAGHSGPCSEQPGPNTAHRLWDNFHLTGILPLVYYCTVCMLWWLSSAFFAGSHCLVCMLFPHCILHVCDIVYVYGA